MDSEQDTEQSTTDSSDEQEESTQSSDDGASEEGKSEDGKSEDGKSDFKYGEDESQDFVDRSKIDFDPEDGLYTGTAITGDSDIPGPSETAIREAQDDLGDDQSGNDGAKAAAEKYIEENDVDLEEAKKGEAIAGSAHGGGGESKADDE